MKKIICYVILVGMRLIKGIFLVCGVVTVGTVACHAAGFLRAESFPGTFQDLSFETRMDVLAAGYDDVGVEYDANGRCVSGCAYKGITLAEEEQLIAIAQEELQQLERMEEVSFNDLPFDEQLQILQYTSLDDNYGLSDEETMFINGLRSNNLSVNDYANYIAKTAVQNYIQSNQGGRQYEIDDISDDELFLIDLQASIPDISEEDALSELDTAKNNPDMYSRKINSLRQEYKERENMLLEQEQQEQQYAAQQQAQQFEAAIVNAVNDSEIIDFGDSSIALSVDDKEEIASYILDSDGAGVRYIAKALQDPATLVRMVWYELKGREAFQQISDYYKREIAEASKNNYTKGYEDAKSGRVANSSKSVVRRPATQNKKKPLSIDELD